MAEAPSEETHTPEAPEGDEWTYARSDRSRRNGPVRRAFRVVRRNVLSPAVPMLVPPALRGLARTWRVTIDGDDLRERILEGPGGCVAVLWHGRMAAAATIFRHVDATILVSASGDGDLADTLLSALGYRTLRGSTGKIGVESLRELRQRLDAGGVVALTPDGPRGPRHRVTPGAAFLARATGRPILPIGFAVERAKHLTSWDRFTIPRPFSRVRVACGDPIEVPRERGAADLPSVSDEVRAALMDAETRAFGALGREVDW